MTVGVSGQLSKNYTNFPNNSSPLREISNGQVRTSFIHEGFYNDTFNLVDSLQNRAFSTELRNPDFNLLGTNGYTPITQADGSGANFSQQWNVFTGGGANAYTITPTPYTMVGYSPSGSNNFVNLAVSALDQALYLYNINYSTTSQFNNVGTYSGKPVTFSTIIENNNDNNATLGFSAFINDVMGLTSNEIEFPSLILRPGINVAPMSGKIPDLRGKTLGANPYIEFRFNVKALNNAPLDCNILYLKAELSNYASPLELNHILEQLICDNLT